MKKITLGMSALVALFSTASVLADDFSGSRIGIGYSKTSIEDEQDVSESGKGIKVEYGYDFNRVIALDVSYETANDSFDNITDAEGSTVKVAADIGYAFYSEKVFFRPYGKVGFVSYSEGDYEEQSAFIGLGLRYQYIDVYADLGVDTFILDNNGEDYTFVETAFTIGYKF